MSYQYHDEDESIFRFKHPDSGHELVVAKKGLSPSALEKIKSMKPEKMADGGVVADEDVPTASRAPAGMLGDAFTSAQKFLFPMQQPVTGDQIADAAKGALKQIPGSQPFSGASTQVPATPTPLLPPEAAGAPPVNRAIGSAPVAPPDANALPQTPAKFDYNAIPGYKETAAGLAGMSKADVSQQNANQASLNDYSKHMELQNQVHQQNLAEIQKGADHELYEMNNGNIDSHRVWSNMGTGNKVLAAISIALSGIGSGLSGKSNMAMDTLNRIQDKDIEDQKANLGKHQNLYSMYLQKYGNETSADAATRLNLNNALQTQFAQTAAKSGSAKAMAEAQMHIGQLKQAAIPYMQTLAKFQTDAQLYGQSGRAQGGFQVGQEPAQYLSDPKYRESRVEVGNRAFQASSPKDAEELRKQEAMYKPIVDDINLLRGIGTQGIYNQEDRSRVQAAMNRLAMNVNEFNGYKRFTDVDHKVISEMFNDPSALKSLMTGQGATADTLKSLQTKLEEGRSHGLIGYKGTTSFKSFKPLGKNGE